MTAKQN